jgi:tripartite-type tricarboxylate transporter receptor subunit TctC
LIFVKTGHRGSERNYQPQDRRGALPHRPACVPKNTPAEIIEKLNREINLGLVDPKMKARFADLGAAVLAGSPADFGHFIAEGTEKWGKVVKFAGMKPD